MIDSCVSRPVSGIEIESILFNEVELAPRTDSDIVLENAQLPDDKTLAIFKHLREGCGTKATGRLLDVVTNTAPRYLAKAWAHAEKLHVEHVALSPGPATSGPGRLPKPMEVLSPVLCDATVQNRHEKGRVVDVMRTLIFGTLYLLDTLLKRSTASMTIHTSFVKRYNGTDRHLNLRKQRKT